MKDKLEISIKLFLLDLPIVISRSISIIAACSKELIILLFGKIRFPHHIHYQFFHNN